MSISDFITGAYVSWLILGFAVTILSFKTWWVIKRQRRPATFFAIGIFFVWLGSALILRPSILYIRHVSESEGIVLTNHPGLLIGALLALIGGNFLVCGFTWFDHGYAYVVASVAMTAAVLFAGAWMSTLGWV